MCNAEVVTKVYADVVGSEERAAVMLAGVIGAWEEGGESEEVRVLRCPEGGASTGNEEMRYSGKGVT